MTYLGDEDDAAPQLRSYRPERLEAETLFRQVIRTVEVMLGANVFHADLSPYNILVWSGRAIVIDLPQAVDPRKNRHAEELLRRDVERVVEYFERFGVRGDAGDLAAGLFTAWTFADLIPGDLSG
jgi:RIO kinase 1